MYRSWRMPPVAVTALGLGLAAAFLMRTNSAIEAEADRDIMLGTWTDEAGEPGNSIRFYLEEEKLGDVPLVRAYMGRVELVNFLGKEKGDATWNYGGWDPLVLNVTIGKRGLFAAIRKIDDNHILIRFGADPEEMYRPGAIDHPDTKRLTRIAREPGW